MSKDYEKLRDFMSSAGIPTDCDLIADEKLNRFHVQGDRVRSENGWYTYYGGDVSICVFGTWKDPGVKYTWCSKEVKEFTKEEKAEYKRRMAESKRKREEEQAKVEAECREWCAKAWAEAPEATDDHPYLVKKGVSAYGLKVFKDSLMVPVRQLLGGVIVGIQFIYPDGTKKFKTGTAKQGAMYMISRPVDDTLIVCEGYATGASIHLSTKHGVLVAFDAGNLKPVAEAARKKCPAWNIVVAADNDAWAKEEKAGAIIYHEVPCTVGGIKRDNVGIIKAKTAALAVDGLLAVPEFLDTTTKPTDFNDLHQSEGFDAVRRQIEAATTPTSEPISEGSEASEGNSVEQKRFSPRKFPFEILANPFDSLVTEYASALQVPAEIMAMCMITIASATIGNSTVLEVKRGWETPPFIWLAIVGNTGSGKSHSVEALMKPVKEQQGKEAIRHKKQMDEYNNVMEAYKANKKGNQPPKEPPAMWHYYTTNFTIESLIPMFQANARGLIVHVDELAGLFKGLNQYKSSGNDQEQILSLFNAGDIKADRKSGGGYVRNSGAAVIGGIQRGIFSKVFCESDYVNGTVYRILPMIMEAPAPRFTLDCISDDASAKWSSFIEWTYKIVLETDPSSGIIKPINLTLEPDALEVWRIFHDRYAETEPFVSPKFRGYIPKLRTYCLKFMTVLHVMECYQHDTLLDVVSLDTVNKAISLTEYFAGQSIQLIKGAAEEQNPYYASLCKTLESLQGEVTGGKLLLSRISERMNELLPDDMQIHEPGFNKQIAAWLRCMKLTVTTGAGNRSSLIWESEKIFT